MGSFFLDNATHDFLFIRPSGNPIDANGFHDMWSSGELILESAEITKVKIRSGSAYSLYERPQMEFQENSNESDLVD